MEGCSIIALLIKPLSACTLSLPFHFRQSSADLLSMGVKYLPALMSMANGGGGGGGNAALGSMLANGLGSMIAGGGGGGGGGSPIRDGYGAPEYFYQALFSNMYTKLIQLQRYLRLGEITFSAQS